MDGAETLVREPSSAYGRAGRRVSLLSYLGLEAVGGKASLGADEALLRRIFRWFPSPPGRVLLVGSRARTLEERVAALGYQVTASEDLLEELPTEPIFSVVLLLEALPPEASLVPILRSLHPCLCEAGRLIVLEVLDLPSSPPGTNPCLSTADLEVALAEAGFCLRREQDWPQEAAMAVEGAMAEAREGRGEAAGAWWEKLHRLQQGLATLRSVAASAEPHRIRTYQEGDEDKIVDLFTEAFHHYRGPDHWAWQYHSNPWGSLKIALAFDDAGQLAAQYAAYPIRFLRLQEGQMEVVRSHQVGDTMTRPSVRSVGRGQSSLLGRTARYFFARFCEGQVAFNYGFNVGNIQRFSMLILRAKKIAPVAFWQRSTSSRELHRLPARKRWTGSRVEAVDSVDERWDGFLRLVAPSYRFLVCRDQAYLKWRYFRRPGFEYHLLAAFERRRLVGWSVFRREGERLIWGDALFSRKSLEAVEHVLAQALASPFAAGATRIVGWFAPQPEWFRKELVRLGFETVPEPQDLSLMMSPFSAQPAPADLRSELYYTLGDSDLF